MFSQSCVSVCAHCPSHLPQPPGDTPPKPAQDATVPFLLTLSCRHSSSQEALLVPGAVPPHIYPCGIAQGSCQPIAPACQGLPEWHQDPLGYQPLLPKLLRVQTAPSPTPLMRVLKGTGPSIDPGAQ